jgi:hypothetical protein
VPRQLPSSPRPRRAAGSRPAAARPNASATPIDLGISVTIYGRDNEGTLFELQDGKASVLPGMPGSREPWPTEQ